MDKEPAKCRGRGNSLCQGPKVVTSLPHGETDRRPAEVLEPKTPSTPQNPVGTAVCARGSQALRKSPEAFKKSRCPGPPQSNPIRAFGGGWLGNCVHLLGDSNGQSRRHSDSKAGALPSFLDPLVGDYAGRKGPFEDFICTFPHCRPNSMFWISLHVASHRCQVTVVLMS